MRALGLLVLAVVMFGTAVGTSITFFYHLTYVLLGLLVVSYLWAWSNLEGLELERESALSRAQVGETARERLTIRNLWPLAKLWVEVRDHSDLPTHNGGFVSYVPGNGRRRWSLRTACTMRGKFTLGPVTVHSGDPFGIFRLYKLVDLTNEIVVYPATLQLPNFRLPAADMPGGQDVRSRTFHVTPNVSTIRQYAPGDSFNRIHWRSTARTGQLMVKEFELDPTADVWIVLDMEARFHHQLDQQRRPDEETLGGQVVVIDNERRTAESTEEYAVTVAASIARHLLAQNRNVGLLAYGEAREVVPPERESRQLFKILEALAVVRARGTMPLAELLVAEGTRFGRNASLIVVTPSLDKRWPDSLQHLIYRGTRAAVVFVDPQSFGSWRDPLEVLGRLGELRTPVYRVRQGQPIDRALAEPEIRAVGGR